MSFPAERDFLNPRQPYLGSKLWDYDIPNLLRCWLSRLNSSSLTLDFHKVALIIQAASKIYSKRVDVIAKDAFDTCIRLNSTVGSFEEEVDGEQQQPEIQTPSTPENVSSETPKKTPRKKPKVKEKEPETPVQILQQKILPVCRRLATLNDNLVIDLNYNIHEFAILESNKRVCYEWFLQILETDKELSIIFIEFWDFKFQFTYNEANLHNVLPETVINHRQKHVLETKMFIFLDIHQAVITVPGDFLSAQEISVYVKNFIFTQRLNVQETGFSHSVTKDSDHSGEQTDEGFASISQNSTVDEGINLTNTTCNMTKIETEMDNTLNSNQYLDYSLNSNRNTDNSLNVSSSFDNTAVDWAYETDSELDELTEGYNDSRFLNSGVSMETELHRNTFAKNNPFGILKRYLNRSSYFKLPEDIMKIEPSTKKLLVKGKKRKNRVPLISSKRRKIILQKFMDSTVDSNLIHFDKLSICTSVNLNNNIEYLFPNTGGIDMYENSERLTQSMSTQLSVGDSGYCDRISRTTSLTHEQILESEIMDVTDYIAETPRPLPDIIDASDYVPETPTPLVGPNCTSTPIVRRFSDIGAQKHLDRIPEGRFLNMLANEWEKYEQEKDERARMLREKEMAIADYNGDCLDVGFDIHQYEADLLQRIPTGVIVKNEELFGGMTSSEVAKNFLAVLNLATEGNVQISSIVKHPDYNSFSITKITDQRLHVEIDHNLFG